MFINILVEFQYKELHKNPLQKVRNHESINSSGIMATNGERGERTFMQRIFEERKNMLKGKIFFTIGIIYIYFNFREKHTVAGKKTGS